MRYFIKLAYNGTPFFGWQIQPKQISVQEILERALSLLLKSKQNSENAESRQLIDLVGCGRTDTGVHAREFYAHFNFHNLLSVAELDNLTYKLNSFLPKEIVIDGITLMHDEAHARFDAIERTYRYYINEKKNPFTFPFAYRVFEKLNVEEMNKAASLLIDTKDFTSFSKLHTQVNNNYCHVRTAIWKEEKGELVFEITANRFLRNMVRALVGTLLEVGKGKMTISEFQVIINKKDRCKAGVSVPAHALFLEKIRYPYSNRL
ncbi:MAG: tRNA pseudouridine(38-40) synthase TruA [Bacteroidales bacterium]